MSSSILPVTDPVRRERIRRWASSRTESNQWSAVAEDLVALLDALEKCERERDAALSRLREVTE